MTSYTYKLTNQTLEEIITEQKRNIPSINERARKAVGIGSPSTWINKKRTGELTTVQIVKLAEFLNMHPSKIFNACLNTMKASEDKSSEN